MGSPVRSPRLSHVYLSDLARWVRARCRRPQLCPDPLHYAARLGLVAIPLRLGEMVIPGPRELVFRLHAAPRIQGGAVLTGLARCVLLLADAPEYAALDVLALAHELALPAEAAGHLTRDVAMMLAPHAPVAMIDSQITLFSSDSRKR